MDKLLQPDTGLMIWTVVTFVSVLLILSKTAWKPILKGLNDREGRIKADLDRAEKAQKEADELRRSFEARLSEAQKAVQTMMADARSEANTAREKLLEAAKAESEKIIEKGRKDLTAETEKLRQTLKNEVAGLSVMIAEKILDRSIDKNVQADVFQQSLADLKGGTFK